MSNLYGLTQFQILSVALIFMRLIAFLFAWPVFGTIFVPNNLKVLFALVISLLLAPLAISGQADPNIDDALILLVLREIAIGLVLGFVARMMFFAVSIAGDLIGLSTGLTAAQMYNPLMSSNGNILEQFQVTLASLLYISMNGHHVFLAGLVKSFEILPLGKLAWSFEGFSNAALLVIDVFEAGIQMAMPVVAAILMTNVGLGILGRAVPQVNVLMTSLAVTLSVGFFVLIVTLPLQFQEVNNLVNEMTAGFFNLMRTL